MPITNSRDGSTRKAYDVAELQDIVRRMRGWNLLCLHAAGSGHAGGTLSVMDIAAALYLSVARHDPLEPRVGSSRSRFLVRRAQGTGVVRVARLRRFTSTRKSA